jgi:diguanylate cyclase (GGDEF)-like protein
MLRLDLLALHTRRHAAAALCGALAWLAPGAGLAAVDGTALAAASTARPQAAARDTEPLESQLRDIERLSKRDPARAQALIAQLDRAALTPRGRLRLAAAQAQTAVFQVRMADALELVDGALAEARRLDEARILAMLLGSRALALNEAHRSVEALAAAEEALVHAERDGDAEVRVDVRIFLVDQAGRRSDFERAFAALEEADQIARASGDAGLLATVAYTGGTLARLVDDLPGALQSYAAAEAGFRTDGDPLGEADAARNRAGLLIRAGRTTEAVEPLQRALDRYRELDDGFGTATAKAHLALALSAQGDSARAFALNAEAIDGLRRSATGDSLASAMVDRLQLKVAHGQLQHAPALVEDIRALLLRSDDLLLRMRFHDAAAQAFAALGRFREAHAALAEQLRLRTRYDDQRLSRQLAAQRGRMESQRMAADLERARRETAAQREALARAERAARWQTSLILLAALAIVLALYALVRTARRSRRNSALAHTDYLTGIHNRRGISEIGQALLDRCRQRAEPFSTLLLDLDHFKSINDAFGHEAGDAALKAVAGELKRHLRHGDELGRYGGEEFVAVLPATSAPRALAIAERLRTAVAALTPQALGFDRPLSVSVGVVTARGERAFAALIGRADDALYQAKEAGRDRVVVAGAPRLRPAAAPDAADVARTALAPTARPLHLTQALTIPQAE